MQHSISCLFAAVKCLNSGIFPSRFMLPVSIISLFGGKWKKKVPLGHLPGTLFLFHLLKKLTKCLIFLPDSILIHEISIWCLFVHIQRAVRSSGVFCVIDPHSGSFIVKPSSPQRMDLSTYSPIQGSAAIQSASLLSQDQDNTIFRPAGPGTSP